MSYNNSNNNNNVSYNSIAFDIFVLSNAFHCMNVGADFIYSMATATTNMGKHFRGIFGAALWMKRDYRVL